MRHVLVVDDEPFIRASIISLIDWSERGYHPPLEAGNGAEAMALLDSHPVDLVLLDMSMPVMTGIEFLHQLSAGYTAVNPAVIVLSAYDDFSLVREAFQLGVTNYTLKSEINETVLLNLLSEAEERLDRSPLSEGTTPNPATDDPEMRRLALNELVSIPFTQSCATLLTKLKITIRFPLILFGVTVLDSRSFNAELSLNERRRSLELLTRTCRDSAAAYGEAAAFLTLGEELCLLLNSVDGISGQVLRQVALETAKRVEQVMNLMVTINCSEPIQSFEDVHPAWLNLKATGRRGSRMVVLARRYIAEHFRQYHISLEEIAAFAGVSRNHLSANFKKETGMTLTEYIAHVRITEAAGLLRRGSMMVYEVAAAAGYANVEHFSRQFKSILGCSPSKYIGQVAD